MLKHKGKRFCSNCFEQIKREPCPYCGHKHGKESVAGTLPPGTELKRRYVIGRRLGKGGFGISYLAYDLALDRIVAIKEYYPSTIAERTGLSVSTNDADENEEAYLDGLEKFMEESELVMCFNGNPNIVGVYDCFRENNTAYFVMEYLEGLPANKYVKQLGRPLDDGETLYIARAITDALIIAHSRNTLHRDISPNNIMLCENQAVKLIDFGAARQVVADQSMSMSVILNKGYAPPEQYRRDGKQGPWTDIYALGSSLLWLKTKKRMTYAIDRTEETDQKNYEALCGSALFEIIERCRRINPEERYQSAIEMKQALDALKIKPKPFLLPSEVEGGQKDRSEENDRTILEDRESKRSDRIKSFLIEQREKSDREVREHVKQQEKDDNQRQKDLHGSKKRKKSAKAKTVIACIAGVVLFAVALVFILLKPNMVTESEESKTTVSDVLDESTEMQSDTSDVIVLEETVPFALQPTLQTLAASDLHCVALKTDGTVFATGANFNGQCDVEDWTGIISVAAGRDFTLGLRRDGSVIVASEGWSYYFDTEDWENIVSIAAEENRSVGVRSDGTVVAVGNNDLGQCEVSDWTDIVAVSAGAYHTAGLKSDGTVLLTGEDEWLNQAHVDTWTDIIAVDLGPDFAVGLKADGTIALASEVRATTFFSGAETWRDIVAISAGWDHIVGVKSDGTVVAIGENKDGQCEVSNWTDIVAVAADYDHTVGLRTDGTVVTTKEKDASDSAGVFPLQMQFRPIAAGRSITLGVKKDGTLAMTNAVTADDFFENEDMDEHNRMARKMLTAWDGMISITIDDTNGYIDPAGIRENGSIISNGSVYNSSYDESFVALEERGASLIGLLSDGTISFRTYSAGETLRAQAERWKEIVDFSANYEICVGVKADGTVETAISNSLKQEAPQWSRDLKTSLDKWTNILTAEVVSSNLVVGVRADGTVLAVRNNESDNNYSIDYEENIAEAVEQWDNIVDISSSDSFSPHLVGLKADGTVVAAGNNSWRQCDVQDWSDIIFIDTAQDITVGLKSNGTVVATGENVYGQCEVGGWRNIRVQ